MFSPLVFSNYLYDAANRLTNAAITQGDSSIRSWSYTYNNRGDRTRQVVTDSNGTAATTTYAYTNHRLASENTNGSIKTYTYDANGNVKKITSDSGSYYYTYNTRNELEYVSTPSGGYIYNYDALSRRISAGLTLYTWAGDNIIREETNDKATDYFYGINLVSRTVTGDAYTYNVRQTSYDEDGNRVVTNIPVNGYNEFYAYDGRGNVVHTLNPDIDLYVSPFFGSTSSLPEADFDGDGLINVKDSSMMSSYYPIVRNYYYSPFGEIWQGEIECDTNPFRYAGEYQDLCSGLIYLRNRYYDPQTGRFITEDPARDGLNWYVYCRNNPIRYIDPTGYITQEEIDLYESGKMAPMAYSHLMNLTFHWYLADDEASKEIYHQWAEDFRANDYKTTNGAFPNVDAGIEYMPSMFFGEPTKEQHYFRNQLNLNFSWNQYTTLQERLPENMKWDDTVAANYHQNNTVNGQPNRKYVSFDGHFELVYNDDNVLLTQYNNPEDMGTYNYAHPDDIAGHTIKDVKPYGAIWIKWGNVPEQAGALYK